MLHNDLNTQRHCTSNVSEQTPSLENYNRNVSCLIILTKLLAIHSYANIQCGICSKCIWW